MSYILMSIDHRYDVLGSATAVWRRSSYVLTDCFTCSVPGFSIPSVLTGVPGSSKPQGRVLSGQKE